MRIYHPYFNPRSHERSDIARFCFVIFFVKFQSTLPREERRHPPVLFPQTEDYFNPRSHERSDLLCICRACICIISIHAPTRGATQHQFFCYQLPPISIHAPTRGATNMTVRQITAAMNFNPRSHERSDVPAQNPFQLQQISIHAPTRGATALNVIWNAFNVFQSTLPREERRYIFGYLSR